MDMMIFLLLLCLQDGTVELKPETGPLPVFKGPFTDVAIIADRPADVTDAPEGDVEWSVFDWAGKKAIVAVGKDQVWADRDLDGDLAEEVPVKYRLGYGDEDAAVFELDLPLGGRTHTAKLELQMWEKGSGRLKNLTRMSGKVQIAGQEVAVSITDYHVNGRYDDVLTTATPKYWMCDHIHIDVDRNGKFTDRIPPKGEDYSLARAFVLGGAVYGCEVLDGGARLRLTKRDTPLVEVKLNVEEFEVSFVHDEYGSCHLAGKSGSAKLPAGTYRFEYYSLRVGKAIVSGNWWSEDGARTFEVKEGTELKLKGDLRYEVFHKRGDEGQLLFWTICFGPNGERVHVWPDGYNGDNVHPDLSVETEDGKTLYSVTSNYC